MTENDIIDLEVTYTQLAIFRSSLATPFNDWSDGQVAQGFSWKPGNVSFRTLEDGLHRIEVVLSSFLPRPSPNAIRAITVPYSVSEPNLEIASISDSAQISVAPGDYQLLCEFLNIQENRRRVRVILSKPSTNTYAVLISDQELSPPTPLVI